MLRAVLLVACGGAVGSALRYLLGVAFAGSAGFPWATLLVNLLGSFVIGLAFGYAPDTSGSEASVRLLLGVGLCGGFTTFSTFSLEGLRLLQAGDVLPYTLYVAASVGLGLLAVWLGHTIARG